MYEMNLSNTVAFISPIFKLWRHPCAQVLFDDDPAPKDHTSSVQNEEMSQAIIK